MAGELIGITGGTGFLGRHLVPLLLTRGHRLRLLVRESSPVGWLAGKSLELVTGDVTDPDAVNRLVAGCDYLVHAAGYFRFWGPRTWFERVNVGGTKNVAQAARRAGLRRLVYVSSVVVVGQHPSDQVIREDTPCHPLDPYQRSKYHAELLLREQFSGWSLPVVILRPSAFYGPFGRYGFNRLFIEDPMRGLRVQVDAGQRLTFPVYVPDAAQAVWLALTRGEPGAVYNIGDKAVSHGRINQMISQLLGIRSRYWNVPRNLMIALAACMELGARLSGKEPFYPLNLRHYVFQDWRVSSEKARAELGFQPTPLAEGLHKTVAWYKTQIG